MPTEYIYNPVAAPSKLEALRDTLSDLYYGSAIGQFAVELTFFIVGCAVVAGTAVAFTA